MKYFLNTLILCLFFESMNALALIGGRQTSQNKLDGKSDLYFIENLGQVWNEKHQPQADVKFVCQQANIKCFVFSDGISYQFTKPLQTAALRNGKDMIKTEEIHRMDIRLVGCNLNSEITTEGKSEGFINYYNRNVLNVHQYEKIIFHQFLLSFLWMISTSP